MANGDEYHRMNAARIAIRRWARPEGGHRSQRLRWAGTGLRYATRQPARHVQQATILNSANAAAGHVQHAEGECG